MYENQELIGRRVRITKSMILLIQVTMKERLFKALEGLLDIPVIRNDEHLQNIFQMMKKTPEKIKPGCDLILDKILREV